MMNILILAAGNPEFDTKDGNYPLCLTELEGIPLIERIVKACEPLQANRSVFGLRKEDVNRYHLDNVVGLLQPGAIALKVEGNTPGAACTALLAAKYIDNDEELLIISANEMLDIDYKAAVDDFRSKLLDAGTVTFPSTHPRYSYVRVNDRGLVTEATEKNPISRHATAGFYWFARGKDFVDAAKNMIRKDAHVNSIFYICPSFNELVLAQKRIGIYSIDAKNYHPLKTERQLHQYEASLEQGAYA
jgi:NDP-sugar pyrophosphorylase family protein